MGHTQRRVRSGLPHVRSRPEVTFTSHRATNVDMIRGTYMTQTPTSFKILTKEILGTFRNLVSADG